MVSTGYNHAETLQKLERLTQLETFVAGQRIRIEKYKAMYETLKAEHQQTEELVLRKDEAMQELRQELRTETGRHQEAINRATLDYDVKSKECEQLRIQVLTPQKLEVLKVKLKEDVDSRYRQKLEASELELNKFRTEFNKLRYDYSFLKSEFENEQIKSKTLLREQEVQSKLQADMVLKERDALFEELTEQKLSVDCQRHRELTKENNQLMQKLKSLHEELGELQHEKESAGTQSDGVSWMQAKQVAELTRRCKSLETEKETTKLQVERLQIELERSLKAQDGVSGEADVHKNQCKTLERKLEEQEHRSRLELNNLQISLTRKNGELERQRDGLQGNMRGCQQRIGILEECIGSLKAELTKKEEDTSGRVQSARDEERSKMVEIETSKAKLEECISESERKFDDLLASSEQQLRHVQEQLTSTLDDKDQLEKEVSTCRSQLQASKLKVGQLEQERCENENMRGAIRQLKNELSQLQGNHGQLLEERNQLQNKTEFLQTELKTAQDDLQLMKDNFHRDVTATRKNAELKTSSLAEETSKLKKELDVAKEKNHRLMKTAKKRHKQQKQDISDLRDKLDILKLKEDQVQKEKLALEKNLNVEHGRTRRRLEKLKQRHNQFNQVLNATSVGVPDINPIVNLSNVSGILLQPRDNPVEPLSSLDDEFHSTPIGEMVADLSV